jgi:hypothetical protein
MVIIWFFYLHLLITDGMSFKDKFTIAEEVTPEKKKEKQKPNSGGAIQ